jgi:hypothetical protein
MKFSTASAIAFTGVALAQDEVVISKMKDIMVIKESHRAARIAAGLFDPDQYQPLSATKCVGGKAGEFSCSNVDLLSFLSHQDMGSTTREGNDVWGASPFLTMPPPASSPSKDVEH